MKRIFALLILLATFASAQTDSTDILITVREDGDTTTVGRWRAGMPVLIRDSWDGWGSREKLPNKFVIIRSGISKAMIDSFLVAHSDSTSGLRRKYQLSRVAIQFAKNNRDAKNIVRVTPAQLRNAFKRANRIRRFSEPQRMDILSEQQFVRWRNMLIGATPTTATVNTDGGGDYTSLAAAEAGEQKDLVAANEQLTINCSGTTADTSPVVVAGWAMDATRGIVVAGDNISGIYAGQHYKMDVTVGTNGYCIQADGYLTIKNIALKINGTGSYATAILAPNLSDIYLAVENCVIVGGSGASLRGITHVDGGSFICVNNVIYNVALGIYVLTSKTALIANNTVFNGVTGFYNQSGSGYILNNNIYQKGVNGTNGFNGTFDAASDYNISDLAGDAPGANSLNSTTVNFADAANGDFRLLAGSPGIDQGVDLSSDPSYPFNTDIIGTVRPQGSAWDIGAFEYVQPATGTDKKSRFNGFGRNGGWKK